MPASRLTGCDPGRVETLTPRAFAQYLSREGGPGESLLRRKSAY